MSKKAKPLKPAGKADDLRKPSKMQPLKKSTKNKLDDQFDNEDEFSENLMDEDGMNFESNFDDDDDDDY
ncbi:MAG: hypothetical protein IPO27_11840 [Bacteroidetes bacterium]|nr:hypothetical protein [Bacteroidota bacterium]